MTSYKSASFIRPSSEASNNIHFNSRAIQKPVIYDSLITPTTHMSYYFLYTHPYICLTSHARTSAVVDFNHKDISTFQRKAVLSRE